MAGLRKYPKGKSYYARIYYRDGDVKTQEKPVPLNTRSRSEAEVRLNEVKRYEGNVIAGKEVEWSWQCTDGQSKIIKLKLIDMIEEYLNWLRCNNRRDQTIERVRICLQNLCKVLGYSFPIEKIMTEHIDQFKSYFQHKHSTNGINLNLSKIKAFLNWLYKRKKIQEMPLIEVLLTPEKLPSYISDTEWAEIMKLRKVKRFNFNKERYFEETLDPHYKRAWIFYRETGCRLFEPFNGRIEGNFLVIPTESHKARKEHEIELESDLLVILGEMRDKLDLCNCKSPREHIKYYSKKFKCALNTIGSLDKKFHSIRHTFAVRRYLQTRDIYQVMKEMGHSSVTTTEIYSRFSLRRLEQDFHTLSEGYLNGDKSQKSGKSEEKRTV